MNVDKPRRRRKLKNIMKGLKEKKAPLIKPTAPVVETAPIIGTSEDLSIGINDATNYAPPGYQVWNYYYDTPIAKNTK